MDEREAITAEKIMSLEKRIEMLQHQNRELEKENEANKQIAHNVQIMLVEAQQKLESIRELCATGAVVPTCFILGVLNDE